MLWILADSTDEAHAPEEHKPLFERLIDANLLALVREKNIDRIDRLLENVLGPGYRYDQLMGAAQAPRE